jgi:hypothetical protein
MRQTMTYRMWKRKKQWVSGTSRQFRPIGISTGIQDGIAAFLFKYILWPLLQLIIACAAALMATGATAMAMASQAAHAPVVGEGGATQAAQTSANMPQARLTVYYNRVFMQWLYAKTNKLLMCTHMDLPEKSGQTWRNFMSIPLGPDITQQTEGTPGPPEQINVNFKDIVVGQWANFNTISDFAALTSISDDLVENRRIMAYQLALTIDDLIMYQMDYLRTMDTRTANQDATTAPYAFTKNIIEQMPGSLEGAEVPQMKDGFYNGSMHPFFVSDLMLDDSNNSIVDIWKHTDAGQLKLEPLDGDDGEAPVRTLELFGCHWRKSTNQTQTANWQGSGETGISTYLAGMDGMCFIQFPHGKLTKPGHKWQNLDLWAEKFTARTAYDANQLIQAGTGYNCVLGIGPPPDVTSRMRIAIAVPMTT